MFLDGMPQLAAHILVGGEFLAEYDDEDTFPTPTSKSKYVEAVAGSTFEVMVTTNAQMAKAKEDCIAGYVYLDGKYVAGGIVRTGSSPTQWANIIGAQKNTNHGSTLERFQFAHLQTTDGPVGKAKAEDFRKLGEVEVKCYWVREAGLTQSSGDPFKSTTGSSVPEKCLKGRAISSHATVGPAEKRHAKVNFTSVTHPYGKEAIATFTFKYRSRKDLQIEGVIPRSPSPVPLEDRDPDDLSPEEARELVRRLRQQQEQIEVKKEGQKKRARSTTIGGDSDIEDVSITGEGPVKKRTRPSRDSGVEIVDLTDD